MYLKLLLVQSMLPPISIFCPTPNLLKLQLRKVFTLKTCDLGGLGLSVALSHRALSQSDERAMPRRSIHRAIGHPMLKFCVCPFTGYSFGSFPLCENVIFDLIWVTKTTLDIYLLLIHHSNLINLPRPQKICPMSARTCTSNSTKNSFPVPCSTQLTQLKLYKLKKGSSQPSSPELSHLQGSAFASRSA